ncbi:MAG: hypothetical protein ACLVAK_09095 [Clostridia bacterium]|jgi:hypothetical protein
MNIIKKFRKSEKGSITVMVLSAMLFLIGTITVSYFAMSNKSIDQNKKVSQIAKQYKASDEDMENEYQKAVNNLKVEDYVKVGDYVDYNPTIASKDGTKVEESKLSYTSPIGTASEHGNGKTEQTFKATADTKWRVLSIKNGTVELISENVIKTFDTNSEFVLRGARGYLYAEQELNEACKIFGYGYGADITKGGNYTVGGPLDTLVTGKIEGTGARSITVEDINKIAGVYEENGQMKYSDGTIINSNYGDTTKPTENIKFPTIDINKGDNITGISKLAQLKNVKNTEYSYTKDKMANQDISEILFGNNYWLASRSINTESTYDFCVSYVYGQNVYIGNAGVCYDLDGNFIERDLSGTIRPIVTLKKNVIDLSNIDSNPEGINVWHLK